MSERRMNAWYAFIDWRKTLDRGQAQDYTDNISYYGFLARVVEGTLPASSLVLADALASVEEYKANVLREATQAPSDSDERALMIVNGRPVSAYFLKK